MTNTQKRWQFFWKVAQLVVLAWLRGIKVIPIDFHRTAEQQNDRYQQGRSKPGKIVTNCDGYEKKSKHQSWLAVDLAIPKSDWSDFIWDFTDDYRKLGELAEHIGLEWGHRWFEQGQTSYDDIFHYQHKEEN